MVLYDTAHRPVSLAGEVARGGEAAVYEIQELPALLAKVYLPAPSAGYERKLAWMRDNPPVDPTRSSGHASLAWPDDLLYDSRGRFVGYLMPFIRHSVLVLEVFNPRLREQTLPDFNWKYLHRAARNLASALGALHARDYIIGDLNESNILVTPTALVTLIDNDSFQVEEHRQAQIVVYPCPVGKPEYTPVELQGRNFGDMLRRPEHDCFALAVLVFQMLMDGNHPFRSRWLGEGDPPTLEEKICQGSFPYAKLRRPATSLPPGDLSLNALHPALAAIMLRCFVDGHQNPGLRPSPGEWTQALAEAEQSLAVCRNGHYFSGHLRNCSRCGAGRVFGCESRPSTRATSGGHPEAAPARPAPSTEPAPAVRRRLVWRGILGLVLLAAVASFWRIAWRPAAPRGRMAAGHPAALPAPGVERSMPGIPAVVSPTPSRVAPETVRVTPTPQPRPAIPRPTPSATKRPLTATPAAPGGAGEAAPRPPKPSPPKRISEENASSLVSKDAFAKHPSAVVGLAFSPNGLVIGCSLASDSAHFYLLAGGTLLFTRIGSCAAYSPDGDLLASGARNGVIYLWRADGTPVLELTGHSRGAVCVAFSPDGAMLASGSADGAVRLWSIADGRLLHTFRGSIWAVTSVAFSPDGALLAAGSRDNTVRLWRIADNSPLHTLRHRRDVTSIAFCPDGSLLAVGCDDQAISLWRVASGTLIRKCAGHAEGVTSVAFSSDGGLLASGARDNSVRVWRPIDGTILSVLTGQENDVTSVAFSPDGTRLASGSVDGAVKIWTVP